MRNFRRRGATGSDSESSDSDAEALQLEDGGANIDDAGGTCLL